jgi:hypothetical protein
MDTHQEHKRAVHEAGRLAAARRRVARAAEPLDPKAGAEEFYKAIGDIQVQINRRYDEKMRAVGYPVGTVIPYYEKSARAIQVQAQRDYREECDELDRGLA